MFLIMAVIKLSTNPESWPAFPSNTHSKGKHTQTHYNAGFEELYYNSRGLYATCSRQLNFSKKKWAVLSAVELFALHLCCCSSVIHAHTYKLCATNHFDNVCNRKKYAHSSPTFVPLTSI